jgi:hypothetical protein
VNKCQNKVFSTKTVGSVQNVKLPKIILQIINFYLFHYRLTAVCCLAYYISGLWRLYEKLMAISMKDVFKTDFYPEFKGVSKKRRNFTNETGGVL